MNDEERAENEEYGEETDKEKANVIFARVVANPQRNRMIEVTNLPLDKLRPITWMKTFNTEAILLFDDIYTAQREYSKMFINNKKEVYDYYKEYFNGLKIKVANGYKVTVKVKNKMNILEKLLNKGSLYETKEIPSDTVIKWCDSELANIKYLESIEYPKINWFEQWGELKDKLILLADDWIYTYCQSRRSLNGEFMRHAVVLAQDQIAANQEGEKENLPDIQQ